jgi:predicted nucleic acid-binding protein
MTKLFVDTSGWANLIDISQPYHDLAVQIYHDRRSQKHKIITTNYIICELVALLSSPLRIPRNKVIAFIQSLKKSPYIHIIHIDEMMDAKAWELLTQREDKEWSLVDCSSFIIMKQRRISEALTNDHHFEQAGLIKLL